MQKKYLSLFIVILIFFVSLVIYFFTNITSSQSTQQPSKPTILVSVLPQKQIAERIVGDEFNVSVIIPPGFSPETYNPKPSDLKLVANAEVYFLIGHIPFELLNLDKIIEVNPNIKIVDTSINNQLITLEAHSHDHDDEHDDEHGDENHDDHDSHHHEGIDPHNWLAPTMVKEQAEIIKVAMIEMYPEKTEFFEENYLSLAQDLDDLHQLLLATFEPIKGKTMLVYHPAFGYLAHIYSFNQEHFQIEGKDPSITQLQSVIEKAKREDIRVIFVQKQFDTSSAVALAENIGGSVVQIDPLDPDYFSNIKFIAEKISENL